MPIPMSSGFHLSIKESAVTYVAPLRIICPICLLFMLCLSSISNCFLDIIEYIFVFISIQDNKPLWIVDALSLMKLGNFPDNISSNVVSHCLYPLCWDSICMCINFFQYLLFLVFPVFSLIFVFVYSSLFYCIVHFIKIILFNFLSLNLHLILPIWIYYLNVVIILVLTSAFGNAYHWIIFFLLSPGFLYQ